MNITSLRCSRCGNSGEVRYLLNNNGEEIGPYDKLCAFEHKYRRIPIHINYPSNSNEILYRRFMRKNLPNNSEMLKLGTRRMKIAILYAILSTLFTIHVYFNIVFQSRGLTFLFIFACIGGFMIFAVELSDQKLITQYTDKLLDILKDGESLYLERSILFFHGFMIFISVIQIFLIPMYLNFLFFSVVLVATLPLILPVLGMILLPLYIFTLFKSPVKALKSAFDRIFIRPLKFSVRRIINLSKFYYRAIPFIHGKNWSYIDTFNKIWSSQAPVGIRSGKFNFITMLLSLPIHLSVVYFFVIVNIGEITLYGLSIIFSAILSIIGIYTSDDLFVNSVTIVIADILTPIIITIVLLWAMEKIYGWLWMKYNWLIVNGRLPPEVVKLKHIDNNKIRPIPAEIARNGYHKKYWETKWL